MKLQKRLGLVALIIDRRSPLVYSLDRTGMSPATRKSPSSQRIDEAVGRQIRTRRQAAKMSQAALGEKVGVTFQQVQKYENGTNRISVSTVVKVAATLQCSVVELLGPALSEEHDSEIRASAVGGSRDLAEMYQELSPSSRSLVAKLIRTLHEQEADRR